MFNPAHCGPAAPPAPRAVHLAGSTTLLPRIQRAAEAFMDADPSATIVIMAGGGTARGYKALLDRTVDIAMASGYMPQELSRNLPDEGRGLHKTILSHDAVVPLVHASNPITNLSMRQLGHIFSGRIGNWRELGWDDAAIEVMVGLPTGGVSSSWKKLVFGADDTFASEVLVLATADRLARCAARPYAISYVSHMPLPDRRLKMVRVNGIMADRTATAYPLRVPMMLVTRDAPTGTARAFIAYAAASGEPASGTGGKHE